jgi:hypothetical protein
LHNHNTIHINKFFHFLFFLIKTQISAWANPNFTPLPPLEFLFENESPPPFVTARAPPT